MISLRQSLGQNGNKLDTKPSPAQDQTLKLNVAF